jgi:hypothetical protein
MFRLNLVYLEQTSASTWTRRVTYKSSCETYLFKLQIWSRVVAADENLVASDTRLSLSFLRSRSGIEPVYIHSEFNGHWINVTTSCKVNVHYTVQHDSGRCIKTCFISTSIQPSNVLKPGAKTFFTLFDYLLEPTHYSPFPLYTSIPWQTSRWNSCEQGTQGWAALKLFLFAVY